jgi:hypothetical protein
LRRVFGGIRDFQLLSPRDVFVSPANDLPVFAAQGVASSLEIEGDHTFRNGSFFRLGLIEQHLSDVQEPSSDGSGAVVPRAHFRAVRAGYEGSFSRDVSFFLNLAYNNVTDRDSSEQIVNVPKFNSEAGIQYLNEAGWFVQPSAYFQSSRRRPDGTNAVSFTTVNLRAGKRFGLRSVVFAEIVNITDKEFDILNVDQPGRQFRVGVIGRF